MPQRLYQHAKDLIQDGAGPTKLTDALKVSETTARRLIERYKGEAEGHLKDSNYEAVRKLKQLYPQWGAKQVAKELHIPLERAKFFLARYIGATT